MHIQVLAHPEWAEWIINSKRRICKKPPENQEAFLLGGKTVLFLKLCFQFFYVQIRDSFFLKESQISIAYLNQYVTQTAMFLIAV